ncbi:MAG: FtsX-like permease family protein [Gemmatimonadales bacterium]|nr:FtsX-like permease family protein [Gemmatimonadales bacterium]
MTPFALGARNLGRHPFRTLLSILGIAVAAAMLLDMVMLAGGIETSFAKLLGGRGFQVRLSPKGTLPFDSEATIPGASAVLTALRQDPAVAQAGPILGLALHAPRRTAAGADTLVTLFGYGLDPAAQGIYALASGADIALGDTLGVLLSPPAAGRLGARVGDTLVLQGRLDPQVAVSAAERRLVVRGMGEFLYDYRGQPSVALPLPVAQALAGQAGADEVSVVMVRIADDAAVAAATARLRERLPAVQVSSIADLVVQFRARLTYFRQLSLILGSISLAVTVLLVGTLLTITVNERLPEIATLRAIGLSRGHIVAQVVIEGAALTLLGGAAGVALGLVTGQCLDRILTSFPGLPAAVSFFVAEPRSIAVAAATLLAAGTLAGAWPAWLAARAPIAGTLRAEAT